MMNLNDIIYRASPPQPWAEGENLPWNDPAFSERMLREHLSQEHDAASRRQPIIDRHVAWIHQELLHARPSRLLDLGCGPGLYTSRLARLGHTCAGIDFSPASIRYARQQAEAENLACMYLLEDVRRADFGCGRGDRYALVMFLFGEFNVFRASDARSILQKAHAVLLPGGKMLLETHPFSAVQQIGQESAHWSTHTSGLFSDRPYLYLEDSHWDASRHAATNRYWVIDAQSGEVTRYASSYQAYTHDEFCLLLEEVGFEQVSFYPALAAAHGEPETDLIAITAIKR